MSEKKSWKRELLEDVAIIGIVLIFWWAGHIGLQLYLGTASPILVVESGSMEPTLYRGDFVIVRAVDPATLQVGDIIIYDPPSLLGETPIVHRIIEIHNESGELRFRTKGDNNASPDGGERTPADVLAKVIGSIRYLGFVTLLLLEPSGFLIVIIIIIFFFVISLVCDFIRPEEETGKAEKSGSLKTKQPDSF